MKRISNIHVMYSTSESFVSAHWEYDGARFHTFVNRTLDGGKTVYKNALVPHGQPGYFETRRLDGTKNANAWMIEEVLRVVKDGKLFELAKAEHDQRRGAANKRSFN